MRICCFDSETLANVPRQIHTMPVDEIAGLTVHLKNPAVFAEFQVSSLLDVLECYDLATVDPAEVARHLEALTLTDGVRITTFTSSLRILEQVTAGRVIDPKTVAWHLKNGVDVETKPRPALSNVETLNNFQAFLADSDAVFTRGNDFDIALIGNLSDSLGVKERFKYNSVRDIRTACDELLQDFKYTPYVTAERVAGSTLGLLYPNLVEIAGRISKLRKAFGHRALYDAVFDLCLYLALKQVAMKEL